MDLPEQTGKPRITAHMHVTACLTGEKADVEVGDDCRTIQALKEAIVKELPQLCVEGFDVSVGGRVLDNDEGVVSLEESVSLDVVPSTRGLSVLSLREAGRQVSEGGLLRAAEGGDVPSCALYLDAGVPVDCADTDSDSDSETEEDNAYMRSTPLHLSCGNGHLAVAALLLNRGSRAIDAKDHSQNTPLHLACGNGHLEVAAHLLDRGSTAIEAKNASSDNPLHLSCRSGHLLLARLLLDRAIDVPRAINVMSRSRNNPLHLACRNGHWPLVALLLNRGSAIDQRDGFGYTPLQLSCRGGHMRVVTLLLDRGSNFDVEEYNTSSPYPPEVLEILLERGYDVPRMTAYA